MRARLALKMAGISVCIREILLKQKPAQMLTLSAKGTVPVMLLPSGQVLEESRDIMVWASKQPSQQNMLAGFDDANTWLDMNDVDFKKNLDRYKYADRYPEHGAEHYRVAGERFLLALESQLQKQHALGITQYLLGSTVTMADIGIFPFVRQFSLVDPALFQQSDYVCVRQWLNYWLASDIFSSIMTRYSPWQPVDQPIIF